MEWQDDEDVIESAMLVLRKLHGDGIPRPSLAHVSRWGSDPFSRGTSQPWGAEAGGECGEAPPPPSFLKPLPLARAAVSSWTLHWVAPPDSAAAPVQNCTERCEQGLAG